MCNSWNHGPDCQCGFGGVGHLGGSSERRAVSDYIALIRLQMDLSRFESYVNRNAICPVCGQEVFFYQSPDGGRVFFDDLSPPWPKHPCTDNGKIPKEVKESRGSKAQWLNNGWKPFDIFELTRDGHGGIVKGYLLDEGESRIIRGHLVTPDRNFENSHVKFLRKIDAEKFEILFINLTNCETERVEILCL